MKKYLIFVIGFYILSLSKILAADYFYDDFNFKDDTKWNYIQKSEDLYYFDGKVDLGQRISSYNYPLFISNKNNLFEIDKDWVMDIDFMYRSTEGLGNGIGIGFTGFDGRLFYQFGIWNDVADGLHFYYNDFKSSSNNCTDFSNIRDETKGRHYERRLNFSNNVFHTFSIKKNDDRYSIYIDDVNIYNTSENQCIPTHLWFGNKASAYGFWSLLSIGRVRLYDGIDIQDTKPKMIILPGFGASWNSEAIIYNKEVDNDQWKMTPFVKNYDNLIFALEQNNLTKNEDFYVWNYDWRKPIEDIVFDLDNFINQKIGDNDKLFLVGHSMGGLVSRIWAEDNNDDTRLQKVITLGSPHLGAVEAYEAWSGGEISDLSRFSSIAFNILLELQSLGIKTKMEAVRNYAPSVKDLLPTFKFAIKDDVLLDNDQLVLKNDYLEMKNDNTSDLNDKLKLFIGEGYKTLSKVSLRGRTAFDKFFNLWPDGRINKKFNEDGDGTVLVKSAKYKNGDIFKISADHGNLIDETINQIMTEIGLNQTEIYQSKNNSGYNLKNNLVFFADPMVDYSVWCDEGIPVLNNDGFIVMENKNYKRCYLNLTSKVSGMSKIVFGNTNNENWTFLQNNIEEGRIVKLEIDPNKGKLLNTRDNLSFIKSMIKKDLDLLMISNDKNKNLIQALKFFNKNNPKLVIKNIFDFQKNNIDEETNSRIINNTLIWMSLTEKCFENKSYRFCSDYFIIGGKYK